ncbi:hypothetical protein [Aureimonas sp. AU40]|uniref:hypothetical protein n=1 Tax=Aureimonas sp. AU40 TaxID=1637747 RepID=UPI00078076FA|nr:hypothetical protein [Aureimonas sp. AU40]
MSKTTRLLSFFKPRHFLDWFGYLLIAPVFGISIYWAWFDTKPVVESEAEISTPVVRQGEDFSIRYRVTWARSCQLTGHRFVVDQKGQIYTVESDTRYIHQGPDEFTITVPIPLAAAPGPARYRATLLYECNPWQRFINPLSRQVQERDFEIIPGTPTAGGLSYLAPQSAPTCGGSKPVPVRAHCRARRTALME